ncbi:hypothetical protein [Chelatococcus reniformis]|uniref:Uncharacterized protein n=1 Tax=Chelatococcus reniformis TaxID=1494448 RepID=A0A916U9G7_9HYPH|nr:hypothetical protein [Chelatococcus reniformis]GGC63513.1 hypothetical protein GCM10010994_22650 [Chelatococcus reniformis]
MRAMVLGTVLVAALTVSAEAQQTRRGAEQEPAPQGQNWLDLGDEGDEEDNGSDYVRESETQSPLDGGMAGSDDLFGNDVLPGGVGGPD